MLLLYSGTIKVVFFNAILFILMVLSGCSNSASHHEFYFVPCNEKDQNWYESIALIDSFKVKRTVGKPSYTLYSNVLRDTILRGKFLDSINRNNYLTIDFLTPFEIKSDIIIKDVDIKVFRKGQKSFNKELKLLSVFVSDLTKNLNPYDFRGKKFSDFDSVRIKKGHYSYNVLMAANYDLSSISDSVFVLNTKMEIIVDKKVHTIHKIDTVCQRTKVSQVSSIRVH